MKNEKIACFVGILTFNNEDTLRACLDSVSEFEEIIICDGGSTDGTLDMAREYGCIVIKQDKKYKHPDNKIADFSGVRNQMLDCAKNDWFVYVDSDEYLSKEIVEEIRGIVSNKEQKPAVYNMPRKYVVNGEKIECSIYYPNYQMRFFHKDAITHFIKKVHERVEICEGYTKQLLKFPMYVPFDTDIRAMTQKHKYYVEIEVERLKDITLKKYLRWSLWFHLRSSIGVLLKYLWLLVSCRGKRMPLRRELLKVEYNFRIIWHVGKGVLLRMTQKKR